MKLLETKHQKKSAAITSVLLILLALVMSVFGMRYVDPPEEYGVAINFGTSDFGSGAPKKVKSVKSRPQKAAPKKQVVKEVKQPPVEKVQEKVLTQDNAEAPVVENKPTEKEVQKPVEKQPEEKELPKEEPKPKVKEVPKPSKETQNALANLLNGNKSDGESVEGEGDDKVAGLKGKETGDPNSSKYYGNGGEGGDGNYNLSGRKVKNRPTINPNCNEEGIVVVRIEVDNSGKVISATPGAKGTTNSAPCLFEPAKKAALQTKWNADGEAPSKQVGTIVYRFSLSE